jgi:hypothetical protein
MPQLTDDVTYPPIAPMLPEERFIIVTSEGIRKLLLAALRISSDQVVTDDLILSHLNGATLADVLTAIDVELHAISTATSLTASMLTSHSTLQTHRSVGNAVVPIDTVATTVVFYDLRIVAHSADLTTVKVWSLRATVAPGPEDASRIVGTATIEDVAADPGTETWTLGIIADTAGFALLPGELPADAVVTVTTLTTETI